MQALAAQGVDPESARDMLGQATSVAQDHVEAAHSSGLLGDHPVRNFFTAFATGLVRGDGVMKSLVDGGEGVLSGKVAESIAQRNGIDSSKASAIAAAATPFVVAFLKQKLG